jgi:hypothetical protein
MKSPLDYMNHKSCVHCGSKYLLLADSLVSAWQEMRYECEACHQIQTGGQIYSAEMAKLQSTRVCVRCGKPEPPHDRDTYRVECACGCSMFDAAKVPQ